MLMVSLVKSKLLGPHIATFASFNEPTPAISPAKLGCGPNSI